MLKPQTVARLRQVTNRTLTNSCDIRSNGPETETPGGGSKPADVLKASGVPCRLSSIRQQAGLFGDTFQETGVAVLHLPYGTNLDTDDVVVIGGKQYEILTVVPAGPLDLDVRAAIKL